MDDIASWAMPLPSCDDHFYMFTLAQVVVASTCMQTLPEVVAMIN